MIIDEHDHDDDALNSDHDSDSPNQAEDVQRQRNDRSKANRKYAGSYMYNARFDDKWLERDEHRGKLDWLAVPLILRYHNEKS